MPLNSKFVVNQLENTGSSPGSTVVKINVSNSPGKIQVMNTSGMIYKNTVTSNKQTSLIFGTSSRNDFGGGRFYQATGACIGVGGIIYCCIALCCLAAIRAVLAASSSGFISFFFFIISLCIFPYQANYWGLLNASLSFSIFAISAIATSNACCSGVLIIWGFCCCRPDFIMAINGFSYQPELFPNMFFQNCEAIFMGLQ